MRTGTLLTITAGALLAASEPSWLDLSRKGMQSLRDGRYAEAEAQFQSAAAFADQTEHGNACLAQLRNNLGSARYLAGNLSRSASAFCDAISHWHLLPEAGPIEPGKAHANLAMLLRTDGNYAAAESEGLDAIRLFESAPNGSAQAAAAFGNLAEVARMRGALGKSELRIRQAETALARFGQGTLDIKAALLMIEGNLWDGHRRPELAGPFYRSAAAYQTKLVGRRHPQTANTQRRSNSTAKLSPFGKTHSGRRTRMSPRDSRIWAACLPCKERFEARSLCIAARSESRTAQARTIH